MPFAFDVICCTFYFYTITSDVINFLLVWFCYCYFNQQNGCVLLHFYIVQCLKKIVSLSFFVFLKNIIFIFRKQIYSAIQRRYKSKKIQTSKTNLKKFDMSNEIIFLGRREQHLYQFRKQRKSCSIDLAALFVFSCALLFVLNCALPQGLVYRSKDKTSEYCINPGMSLNF